MGTPDRSAEEIDDLVFLQFAKNALATSAWPDRGVDEVIAKLDAVHGPERIVDMLMRMGPYGDGFGRRPTGLSLDRVRQAPHGIDLGPLQPRLREVLNTASGVIELAPPTMIDDLPRLLARMAERNSAMMLIGRRDLRASRVGSVVAPVEVTDELMRGVVSPPHGWGHDAEGAQLSVARAHPGVNANILTDDRLYDEASGTAVLFGTAVTVEHAGGEVAST